MEICVAGSVLVRGVRVLRMLMEDWVPGVEITRVGLLTKAPYNRVRNRPKIRVVLRSRSAHDI